MLTIWLCINTTSVISKRGTLSPFLSLFVFLLVLPSHFIVSGIKSLRKYLNLILNVILFSILFMHILIEGHYIKSVQIQIFFWSVFSFIRTEYGDFWSSPKTGKYRQEKTLWHFSRSGIINLFSMCFKDIHKIILNIWYGIRLIR